MSVADIPENKSVIPYIKSDLFIGHEEKRFAVGIVALGNVVVSGCANEFHGYSLLRGNVYAHEMNFMPIKDLNADGTESDADDKRSVHFAIIENALHSPRVVGAMRLIIKANESDAPLPIEEHYPEVFVDGPLGALSTEVSRVISRHEDAAVQRRLKRPLFSAGVSYAIANDLGPTFGAVETHFQRVLTMDGVPVEALAEPHYVPEYNATKLPIRVDTELLGKRLQEQDPHYLAAAKLMSGKFVYIESVVQVQSSDKTRLTVA